MSEAASEVAQLLGEIRTLSGPPEESEPEPQVEASPREYTLTLRGRSFDVERDEFGRVKRLLGPEGVKTLVRDEQGMVVRIDEELEELTSE